MKFKNPAQYFQPELVEKLCIEFSIAQLSILGYVAIRPARVNYAILLLAEFIDDQQPGMRAFFELKSLLKDMTGYEIVLVTPATMTEESYGFTLDKPHVLYQA